MNARAIGQFCFDNFRVVMNARAIDPFCFDNFRVVMSAWAIGPLFYFGCAFVLCARAIGLSSLIRLTCMSCTPLLGYFHTFSWTLGRFDYRAIARAIGLWFCNIKFMRPTFVSYLIIDIRFVAF